MKLLCVTDQSIQGKTLDLPAQDVAHTRLIGLNLFGDFFLEKSVLALVFRNKLAKLIFRAIDLRSVLRKRQVTTGIIRV